MFRDPWDNRPTRTRVKDALMIPVTVLLFLAVAVGLAAICSAIDRSAQGACYELRDTPAYSRTYEDGARVDVPSGDVLVKEANGNKEACTALLEQYETDRESSGFSYITH